MRLEILQLIKRLATYMVPTPLQAEILENVRRSDCIHISGLLNKFFKLILAPMESARSLLLIRASAFVP
jgi:hypothetical protein